MAQLTTKAAAQTSNPTKTKESEETKETKEPKSAAEGLEKAGKKNQPREEPVMYALDSTDEVPEGFEELFVNERLFRPEVSLGYQVEGIVVGMRLGMGDPTSDAGVFDAFEIKLTKPTMVADEADNSDKPRLEVVYPGEMVLVICTMKLEKLRAFAMHPTTTCLVIIRPTKRIKLKDGVKKLWKYRVFVHPNPISKLSVQLTPENFFRLIEGTPAPLPLNVPEVTEDQESRYNAEERAGMRQGA